MILFQTGDVLKLLDDVSSTAFDEWAKTLQPVSGGLGAGSPKQWSLTQTVGFVVADRIRQGPQGCVSTYIPKVVEAFGAVSEEELLALFKKNGSCFVMPHYGKPHFQGDDGSGFFPNAKDAYKLVKEQAQKKAQAALSKSKLGAKLGAKGRK